MKRKTTARESLLRAEALAGLLALAALGMAALAYRLAPVGAAADPAQATAPWVLVGVQVLLGYLPAWLGGLLLPAVAWLLLGSMPWLCQGPGPVRPAGGRPIGLAGALGLAVLLSWVVLTVVGMRVL